MKNLFLKFWNCEYGRKIFQHIFRNINPMSTCENFEKKIESKMDFLHTFINKILIN